MCVVHIITLSEYHFRIHSYNMGVYQTRNFVEVLVSYIPTSLNEAHYL